MSTDFYFGMIFGEFLIIVLIEILDYFNEKRLRREVETMIADLHAEQRRLEQVRKLRP